MGHNMEARKVIEEGLASRARSGDLTMQRDLLVQRSPIEETSGNLEEALDITDAALAFVSQVSRAS